MERVPPQGQRKVTDNEVIVVSSAHLLRSCESAAVDRRVRRSPSREISQSTIRGQQPQVGFRKEGRHSFRLSETSTVTVAVTPLWKFLTVLSEIGLSSIAFGDCYFGGVTPGSTAFAARFAS